MYLAIRPLVYFQPRVPIPTRPTAHGMVVCPMPLTSKLTEGKCAPLGFYVAVMNERKGLGDDGKLNFLAAVLSMMMVN